MERHDEGEMGRGAAATHRPNADRAVLDKAEHGRSRDRLGVLCAHGLVQRHILAMALYHKQCTRTRREKRSMQRGLA